MRTRRRWPFGPPTSGYALKAGRIPLVTMMSVRSEFSGITTAAIREHGVDFAEGYRRFVDFAGPLPVIAFGRDDLVLADNIRLYGLKTVPALAGVVDIRRWLIDNGIDVRGLHACDVGPAAGVTFDGHTHDGLADARSVAAGIAALMARGAPRPALTAPEIYP